MKDLQYKLYTNADYFGFYLYSREHTDLQRHYRGREGECDSLRVWECESVRDREIER